MTFSVVYILLIDCELILHSPRLIDSLENFKTLRFIYQMQNMYLLQNIDTITNQYYVSPIEQLLFAHRWWRDDIDSGLLRLSSMLIVLPTGGAALPPTTTSLDWLTACFAVLHRICYKKQIPPLLSHESEKTRESPKPHAILQSLHW